MSQPPHFLDDLWMGPGTLKIKPEMYQENRRRLAERLKERHLKDPIVLLEGGREIPVYDTDASYAFRQEPFFNWAFGIQEMGFHVPGTPAISGMAPKAKDLPTTAFSSIGAMQQSAQISPPMGPPAKEKLGCYAILEVNTGKSIGFFPKLPKETIKWMGETLYLENLKSKYKLDQAFYSEDLQRILKKAFSGCTILVLKGINSDSGLAFSELSVEGIENFSVNKEILYQEMSDLRTVKTDYEIEVMKYVCKISSEAHKQVMLFARPGKFQYQCEAEFMNYCYAKGGCRLFNYCCICSSGKTASILHYGHALKPNDDVIKDGEICSFDMGASYFGYSSDITCAFPANGKFSDDQKLIYEAVLDANLAVIQNAKPGITWDCMHRLANCVLLERLRKGGLLKGNLNEMMKVDLAFYFQPSGLGHLLGLDVHDVGGYLDGHPPRPKSKACRYLRTARTLVKGMVITIEPGCYFIDYLLDEAFGDPELSKFLVQEQIERFRSFGGLRIEDDVLITEDGAVCLNCVPRTVKEIEEWMNNRRLVCQ